MRTSEPIAGYHVTERLGAGGYGEVWKAEAPGGLSKAIKFIYGYMSDEKAARELKALNRIKQLRHPFLLSLERIEVVDGQLLIVTELADMSLKDRYQACKESGLDAIARDELIDYMRDAADALDYLSQNALQHLDVKPENLLLVGGRVKVADFGLVKDIKDRTCSMMGGMTPVYAPPESFDGRPTSFSDQYSLAVVYQEMLTGVLPFPGTTAAQLASQHLHSRPRLESLPAHDRPVILKALAKNPTERFKTSRAMVDALLAAGNLSQSQQTGGTREHSTPNTSNETTSVSGQDTEPPAIAARSGGGTPIDRRTPSPNAGRAELRAAPAIRLTESRTKTAPPISQPVVADLPPIEITPEEIGLRPTLFLGIGGTASHVLGQLRRRLNDRFGDLSSVPMFQMLLLDTDNQALSDATGHAHTGGLRSDETLAMPLRKPQDYRADSLDILQWLSRRWLYNIPRSLQTEGLRPLGRLAMVDHSHELFERLRGALSNITAPESLAASQQHTGQALRDRVPRVFIVSSISGGTGSGMVLDVSYAVRMLLADMGIADAGVCGILTHSTNRKTTAKDLSIANAYACLSEMYHYSRSRYPGEPACGLPAFDYEQATFPTAYFVHLGDHLNDNEFHRSADALAEYLYLDAATAGGAFFDKCRESDALPNDQQQPKLRTLGVCQLGCSQSNLPANVAEILCRGLVERWIGDLRRGKSATASLDELVEQQCQSLDAALKLNVRAVLDAFAIPIEATLGLNRESFFHAVACRLHADVQNAASLGESQLRQLALEAKQALGLHEQSPDDEPTVPLVELAAVIDGTCGDVIESLQARMVDAICRLADDPRFRIAGAHGTVERITERLRALESQVAAELKSLQEQIANWSKGPIDSAVAARGRGWTKTAERARAHVSLHDHLSDCFELLVKWATAGGALRVVRGLLHQAAMLSEQFVNLRRELSRIGKGFDGELPTSDPAGDASKSNQSIVQTVLKEIEGRLPHLLLELEKRIQHELLASQGGLVAVLSGGADQLNSLPVVMRITARQQVVKSLKEIDIASIVLGPPTAPVEDSAVLHRCVQTAWPSLLKCGGAKRLLLVMPEGAAIDRMPEILAQNRQEQSTILFDADCDVVACYEAEQLSLATVAAALAYDGPQYAEVARRLHTRIDIEWSTLGS